MGWVNRTSDDGSSRRAFLQGAAAGGVGVTLAAGAYTQRDWLLGGSDAATSLAEASTDWAAGDELLVAGLDPDENQDEAVTVAGVSGSTVDLEGSLTHDHVPPGGCSEHRSTPGRRGSAAVRTPTRCSSGESRLRLEE